MKQELKASDHVLKEIVDARRAEVVRLQKAQADSQTEQNTRGLARLADLKKSLPKEIAATLDYLDNKHDEAAAAAKRHVESVAAKVAASASAPENDTAVHPGLAGGHLNAPSSLGWFTPYYGTLHGSDGSVYWQGYNPGNIDLSDYADGAGSGLFGTGAGSFTVYMDWWFTYRPTQDRNYSHTIYVPFHGFYVVYSDDGFWDSKESHVRIDLSAVGVQYNTKPVGGTNVLDLDSQNINVNDRFDGWRTMYYSDLLGADQAYLRVTASFYVYARGGGSVAQLNFAAGDANYMGVPWVYVD
jgi:hypothetical protein